MDNKFYLYRWIRLDKNEPFYIGIGTKINNKYYSRLKDVKTKNRIFKSIFNKTKTYTEIILESNDYDFIKQKEIEFITLYGRIDLGTGILSNMTKGGDGNTNNVRLYGRNNSLSKPVYQFDLFGNLLHIWESVSYIHKTFKNYNISTLAKCCRQKECKTCYGYYWSYVNKFELIKFKNSFKKCYQYDLEGNFIREWNSITEAAKFYNSKSSKIHKCMNKKHLIAFNCYWRYDKENFKLYQKQNNHKTRPVINLLTNKSYKSISDLSKDINVRPSDIIEHIKSAKNKKYKYL